MRLFPKQDDDGKWGFVDERDVWQIYALFDNVSPFEGEYAKATAYGESFYINKKGKWYKKIPDDPNAPEDAIMMKPSYRSPLDIFLDGCSKATDILHKGLRECE